MIRRLQAHAIALLGWAFYRLLSVSWRIQVIEPDSLKKLRESNGPCVFAHWHGDELAILHLLKPYRVCAMVSTSKDGELMTRLVQLLGGKTSRGSSTRGGFSALRGILKLVKQGFRPSVAVDGPKGPIHKVKPGVFELAKLLDIPIYPMGIYASNSWHFPRSWNQTYLPKFFAKVIVVFAHPMPAPAKDSDPRDVQLASELESRLMRVRNEARELDPSR